MIKIAHGTGRVSVLIPFLGIVIKIVKPRRPLGMLKNVCAQIIAGYYSKAAFMYLWNTSFRGLTENIQEMSLSERTGMPLLCPTYFSIGVVNIQKYERNVLAIGPEFLNQISLLTEANIWDNIHTFASSGNFALGSEGRLVMLDYGNPVVEKLIRAFGDRLHRDFDPAYKVTPEDRLGISEYECAWSDRRKQGRKFQAAP